MRAVTSLGRREAVDEEQRRFGNDQLPGLESLDDLSEAVLLKADPDRSLDQALVVSRDPRDHPSVALAHDGARRNAGRSSLGTRQDAKARKHVRLELAV